MSLLPQDRAKTRRPGNGWPPRLLPHLLIVEDDPTLREILALRFARAYRVLQAACGEEALRLLGSGPVHLILLDNRLPDGNGLDLLPTLKQRWPSIPILFVTAYSSEEVAVEAFRRGARDYFTKPFDFWDLERRIAELVEVSSGSGESRQPLAGPTTTHFPQSALPHQGLRRAMEHLRDHACETALRRRVIARLAGMSPTHFSRRFKVAMGKSWVVCLAELRVQKASALLQDDLLSVTEVAHRCGFQDLTHFERVFKRYTGLTPRAYRKSRQ
jgi:YesN/AraC family two-component response regulator